MAVYTGRDGTLLSWAVVTRHVHGRVHVPYAAVYMFVYTGRVQAAYTDRMPYQAAHSRSVPSGHVYTARHAYLPYRRPRRPLYTAV